MYSHKIPLVPIHRPVYRPTVMSEHEASSELLQADDNASRTDDAVVVDMSVADEDCQDEVEYEYQYGMDERGASPSRSGLAGKVLVGVGAVASLLGLYKYFWPRDHGLYAPEDAHEVFDMLNKGTTSPAKSHSDVLSQIVRDLCLKSPDYLAAILRVMMLTQSFRASSLSGSSQMFSLPTATSASTIAPGRVPGDLLSGASFSNVSAACCDVWNVSNAAMTREMARIETLVIRDLRFLFDSEGERVVGRKRRGVFSSGKRHVDDHEIEEKVRHVFKGKNLSEDFLQLGQRLVDRVEADEDVVTAAPEERPVLFYVATLELVIEDLKWHVKNDEINPVYHFLYSRLMQLRAMEEWFSNDGTRERVERYNQRLREENLTFLALQRLRPEQNEVDVFLKLKHNYWYGKGVRSTEKVAIHRKNETLIFSLHALLEQRHVDADGHPAAGKYTFLFDSSGLAYGQESGELFQAIRNDQFSQFREDASYQEYIRQCSQALFQERLGALQMDHLLYLDRKAVVESVKNDLDRTPPLATVSGNEDLMQAIDGFLVRQHLNVTEASTYAYAQYRLGLLDSQLFEGMDSEKIFSADYRYVYRDDSGEMFYDTAPLADVLSKNTGAANIGIAQCRDVSVNYPPEFSTELKAALQEVSQQVDMFWVQAQAEIAFRQLRFALENEMPSLIMRIFKKANEICQHVGMSEDSCNLKKLFVFSYDLRFHAPVVKTLTLGQILSGDLRKLDAEYSVRTRRIIGFPKNDVTQGEEEQFTRLVRYSNNQEMQKEILASLEHLKNDLLVKNWFERYVMHLTAKIPGKHIETSELASSPLLRIIKTRIPSSNNGGYESKAYVLSILTGDVYEFESSFYAINAMQRGSTDIANLDAHFAMGKRQAYDRKLLAVNELDRHFERVIQHQQDNVDKLFTSIAESHLFGLLELLSDLGPYAIEVLVPGPVLNTFLSALISSAPKVAQGFVFPLERERLNQIALRNFFKGVANGIAGPPSAKVSSAFIRSEFEKIFKGNSAFFEGGVGKLIAGKAGEKGVSYSIDALIDYAADYFVGKVPNATLIEVPDFMLSMAKGIDFTGSFQLYQSLFVNASRQAAPGDD